MTTRFNFNFDGYDDFDSFLEKHSDLINKMGNSEVNDEDLTDQMRMSVQANEQLPEFFEFTDQQLGAMYKRDAKGMKALMEDDRVSVEKNVGENEE